MAIYTTLFLCKPQELIGGFPGWRMPLEQPVLREFRDPFSGKTIMVETREPEWSDNVEDLPEIEYQVVSIEGSYLDYLENRLPLFIHDLPHWAMKNLTEVELGPLLGVLDVEGAMDYPIYGPKSSNAVVQQFPPEFVDKLLACDRAKASREWAAIMSTPEYTHSVSGVKLNDGWSPEDAKEILERIASLGRAATDGQLMYLLTEW